MHAYMIYTQRFTCVYTRARRILKELFHWAGNQLLTQPPAHFGGSKELTFVCSCAGACTKNVPVNSVWNIRKTNADFHSPKEHFRHLHQKYPERQKKKKKDFFFPITFAIRWNMLCPWNETRDKNDVFNCLKAFCWGDLDGKSTYFNSPLVNLHVELFWRKSYALFLSRNFGVQ